MENKIFNVVVIGCIMGHRHIEAVLENDNAHLYGACDIDPKLLDKIKEKYNPDNTTLDWKDFVNDPKVDIAVVATPDKLHLEMVCTFLRAGKHVLCEKPMALTMEECEEMIRVEKETGNKLMVGQVARFSPPYRKTKRMIENGMIGDLFLVEGEYAHDYSIHRGASDWRLDPDRHAVIGGGCHSVDFLRWVAGNPTEVYGLSNHKCLTDWPVDDCAIALMKFPNGVIGKVMTSIGCKRAYTGRSVFYGTKGTIICDSKTPFVTYYHGEEINKIAYDRAWYNVPQQIPVTVKSHNTRDELKMLLDALVKDEPMPITSMEGASTVAVCCAIVESCKTGLPVKVKYPQA